MSLYMRLLVTSLLMSALCVITIRSIEGTKDTRRKVMALGVLTILLGFFFVLAILSLLGYVWL
jgi:heme/copper-type cytochrome/quinol oxidase subunit 3